MMADSYMARRLRRGDLQDIFGKVEAGERLSFEDGLRLYAAPDLNAVGFMANLVRERMHGDRTYFNVNSHINYSNICVLWKACKFCAFGKKEGQKDAYEYSLDEIFKMAEELGRGRTEFHMVGGLHPDLPFDYYLEMIRGIKRIHPQLHLKCFTATEVRWLADRVAGLSVEETLRALVEAGLGSLTGGGAEIFAEPTRSIICKGKQGAEDWLGVHRAAHGMGLRSTCTMLYGHVETGADRVDHMLRLRALQDETGGFTAFIPLAFHPANTQMAGIAAAGGMADLRNYAVARLLLDNIAHIKAYWVMVGVAIAQISQGYGVDDIDGTVVQEKIYHMAGAQTPQRLGVDDICRLIREAGREPVERDTLYREVVREGDRWAVLA
ncbi:MAG: aminofutalosine synthase MqnE [Candidatus Tectomicrobia bacterium]|nr:aminofutalosine synthase MqnE [Candidatus Tectomicrobia bacterium]